MKNSMNPDHLVYVLENEGREFCTDSVRNALKMENKLKPIFLSSLREIKDGSRFDGTAIPDMQCYNFHFYALYCLGIWRSFEAVPLLLDMCKLLGNDEDIEELWSGRLVTDFPVVLAECITKEQLPLFTDLLYNNHFTHDLHCLAICDVFVYLLQIGTLSEEELKAYLLADFFPFAENRENSYLLRKAVIGLFLDLKYPETKEICKKFGKEVGEEEGPRFTLDNIKKAFSTPRSDSWGFRNYKERKSEKLLFEDLTDIGFLFRRD